MIKAGDDEALVLDSLDELESLLATLRIPVVGRVVQRRQKPTASCLVGSGKVLEIRDLALENGAGLVVFDHLLAPPQIRNLEAMTERLVVDRTGVILEIFSRHARSNQAKTQVEIAKMEYLMPRLSGAWSHFQRQSGGGVMRGMGEKQIEVDRRRARDRVARLAKQMVQFQRDRAVQRKARRNELKVALVGYTNSGKTTLMNNLTHAAGDARNELFATLDTHIKTIDPRTRPKILVSDTVGFIRNLPHSLFESFKSTLEEVLEADLLLHVVDVSHPNYRDHIQTTVDVLKDIGAKDIPTLMIFNKADRLDEQLLPRILVAAWPRSLVVSALNSQDGERLRDHVYEYFKSDLVCAEVQVPISDQQTQSLVHNSCLIVDSDYTEPGSVRFNIQTTRALLAKLANFAVGDATKVVFSEG